MFAKIISVILSLVITASGTSLSPLSSIADSISEILFGIPATFESIKSDFMDDIGLSDVTEINGETGFVNNKIMVFVDSEAKYFEKYSLFKNCGGILAGWSTPADLYVVSYPVRMSYEQIQAKCSELAENSSVALAIPVLTHKTELQAVPNDSFSEEASGSIAWDEKNPSGKNWWLEAIQARQAWDYKNYLGSVNIGVVDAGFDVTHPELEGKISFPNTFQALRNSVELHGCHVAGIIGAKHNNGVGITGVCNNANLICVDWTPGLFQFWFTELAIFFGISSVVKAGAKVVNLSLGTSSSMLEGDMSLIDESIVPKAVSYMMSSLLSKGYDFIAVQSAGNGDMFGNPIDARYNGHFCNINELNIYTGSNNVSADEILNRILIVGSVGNDGDGTYTQSVFSNTGKKINIAAPGEKIYSCSYLGEYEELDGTSMSAPVVSGVAGLVWSVNPSFTGTEVKEILCTSYESIAEINGKVDYNNDVQLFEYPIVNAKLAVEEAIKRTDKTVGTVMGNAGSGVAEIIFDGASHTVFSDGSFSFVTPAKSGTAQAVDSLGNVINSVEISVNSGEITYLF